MKKIKASPQNTKDLAEVKVKSEKDLEEVAKHIDSPILDCEDKGYDAVIDGRNKTIFFLPKKKTTA